MKILMANPFGIGDVLFSTPLISNLKAAYPDCYIGYICNQRAKDVLYDNREINQIFVFEKDEYRELWRKNKFSCIKKFISFLWQIKKVKFEVVIDLSLGHQYSFFLWLIGIKKRLGYNYRNRGRFLTEKIDISGYEDKPIADYYLDLLKFFDIQPRRFNLTINFSSPDQQWAQRFFKDNGLRGQDFVVGIIPAGGASWGKNFSYRHWPWEYYGQLADKLVSEMQAQVIIFGAASEQGICRQIQSSMRSPSVSSCGETSFKQFTALLARCNLVVCNDGGPLHVAVSQNVLTVSIFGPVDERVYGPYPPESRHIVVTNNIACRPCYKKFRLPVCQRNRECIKDITAERVFNIIKERLG
ncbi:glycosyltransferase family 9 protein [Candidatus Omnitrophota bacterium]